MEAINRQTYFDFLRGFAILLVIGIHTYTVRPFEGTSNIIQIGFRESINFAVPLFLAISGFFTGRKKITSSADYFSFLKRQLPRVYLPAMLWSLPMVVLCILRGQNAMVVMGKGLLCMTFGPYYFIVLIMQLYILLPVIKRLSFNPKVGGVFLLVINMLSVLALIYVINNEKLTPVLYVGPFLYWIIFFYIGVCFSERNRNYSLIWPLMLILAGFVAQVFETKYLISCGHIGVGIKLSSWVYSAGVILLLFSSKMEQLITKSGWFYQILVKIGGISFGVYLTHVYFLIIENTLLHTSNWIVSFIATALMTILFVLGLKALLPARYRRVLGLN